MSLVGAPGCTPRLRARPVHVLHMECLPLLVGALLVLLRVLLKKEILGKSPYYAACYIDRLASHLSCSIHPPVATRGPSPVLRATLIAGTLISRMTQTFRGIPYGPENSTP